MKLNQTSVLTGLLLSLFLLAAQYVNGQELSKKITVVVQDQPLGVILKQISEQGGIPFSYNPRLIPVERRVSLNAVQQPISLILDELLVKNGIDYMLVENQVILRPHNNPHDPSKSPSGVIKSYTLSGFLREKSSGEALIGATVQLRGTSLGTFTNGYGFYSLTLPEGSYRVSFSYLGYKELAEEVDLRSNRVFDTELEESLIEAREVEIVAANPESDLRNNQLSEFSFSHKSLARLPGFAGNLDIIRALQAVPGIQTFGDGSSRYYVRGGNADENLMLIDEVPVYNPSHLFGFFSAFSPDAINDVQIFKGDFPAKYGGRLSSVIDIKAREGNMKRFGVSGNIGPYATNLTVEGPILKNRASFILAGRVSTLNWINSLTEILPNVKFQFFDINAKLNFKINDNNRLFFTFYAGKDDFSRITENSFRTYGISWNNLAGTFRWNHLFSNKLFSNTTLNYSRYNYDLFISSKQDDYWTSQISNTTLKTDLTWYLNPRNTLKGGVEVTTHYSNPGNVTLTNPLSQEQAPVVAKYHSIEYNLYVGNEQSIGRKLTLRYGIRLQVWQDVGPTTIYSFNVNHLVSDTLEVANMEGYQTYFSPEPRFNIRYDIRPNLAVKFSYTRMTQFMQLLTNSTSPFTSLEVWAPSGPNIKPQIADQFSLGYFMKFPKPMLNLSAEIYYKYYQNHLDYKEHANLLYNPLIEGELRFGKAWSYGLELMLRKPEGRFTGWIGYTYSRAFIRTPEVNNGEIYPASWDRPHDFCINLAYTNFKRWAITVNWFYLTGGAITTPVGFFYINNTSVPLYGAKNNDRLPDYHRLDLAVTYTFSKPESRYQHSVTATLYNAYGRLNPFSVSFNKTLNADGEFVVPSNTEHTNTLYPTTLSVAGIIPSINYLFRF